MRQSMTGAEKSGQQQQRQQHVQEPRSRQRRRLPVRGGQVGRDLEEGGRPDRQGGVEGRRVQPRGRALQHHQGEKTVVAT